jgi:rod shape-determining protein MreC
MTGRFQQQLIITSLLVALSGIVIVVSPVPAFQPVRDVFAYPLAFFQRPVATIWERVLSVIAEDPEANSLRERNAALEAEVARLNGEVVRLQENEADLRILSSLVNYAQTQPNNQYLAANVIGRDSNALLGFIILDRGTDDGVRRGMPVVTGDGLVGTVIEVTRNACKVRPITDPVSRIATRLQLSREAGVVEGGIGGTLQLNFISQQAQVSEGELVLTSGLGGDYPADIVVGSVTNVQQLNFEVLQSATLIPAVDFGQLEIVLIITDFDPIDLAPFFSQPTPTPSTLVQP